MGVAAAIKLYSQKQKGPRLVGRSWSTALRPRDGGGEGGPAGTSSKESTSRAMAFALLPSEQTGLVARKRLPRAHCTAQKGRTWSPGPGSTPQRLWEPHGSPVSMLSRLLSQSVSGKWSAPTPPSLLSTGGHSGTGQRQVPQFSVATALTFSNTGSPQT